APLWTRSYLGRPNAIAVDNSGNVFVTVGGAIVAYSSAGVPLWTNNGSAAKLALDSAGNVFVTGSASNGVDSDFATIKYSSSISLPRLDFQKLDNQLVLSWTNSGFNLQSAPSASGTFTNIPGSTSPYTNSL